MNIINLPKEIIIEIFGRLSLNELIGLESVLHSFRNIVRITKWYHIFVKLKNINYIQYVTQNYQFVNFDFRYSSITDEGVKHLANCHTLNLYGCHQIMDETKKQLKTSIKRLIY